MARKTKETEAGARDHEHVVFVHRKGNGGAFVSPSPTVLRPGDQLVVRNFTGDSAKVVFPKGLMRPRTATIEPREAECFTALDAEPAYYEYDVQLDAGINLLQPTQHAEGNSRPGVIIDR